jgi:hypothetical protein
LTIEEGVVSHAKPNTATVSQPATASRQASIASPTVPAPQAVHMRSTVVLKAAADLSTEFGRARDQEELGRLLGRAADMLDASGLIVWITDGDALRPVLVARLLARHARADVSDAAVGRQCGRRCLPNRVVTDRFVQAGRYAGSDCRANPDGQWLHGRVIG